MWSMIRKIVTAINIFNDWVGSILSSGIYILIGVILYEVIARYFFNSPTVWSMEFSIMVHGGYIVAAGAYASLKGGHVRMDLFYAKWSPRKKAIADCLTFPLIIVFIATLLWLSIQYAIDAVHVNETSHSAWEQPLYHWRIAIAAGIAMLIIQCLANFLRDLKMAITGEEL